MKNSNDTFGNRTADLPACSGVPQPTAHRVPRIFREYWCIKDILYGIKFCACLLQMVKYILSILLPYPYVVLTVYYYSIIVWC